MLKTFTLDNGLRVATYNIPTLRSIYLNVSIKAGSIMETKENNGIAHFTEHMLLQGTPSFPTAQSLSAYIESLAGSYNAHTYEFLINFHISLPFRHLDKSLKIASEVVFESTFPKDVVEKERGAIIQEVRQNSDSLYYKLGGFIRRTRYREMSPFRLHPVGSIDVLKNLSRNELVRFWKSSFVPERAYLLLCGNLGHGNLEKLVMEVFEKYPRGGIFPSFPDVSDSLLGRNMVINNDKGLNSNYVDFFWPSLKLGDALVNRLRQSMLLDITATLWNSRLSTLLRHKLGLVYSVGASHRCFDGLGDCNIYTETESDKLERVISLITDTLYDLADKGPTEKELSFEKEYITDRWLMAFDSPSSIADWIHGDFLWEDKIRMPEEYIELIKGTTVGDLRDLMQKYWDFSKLQFIVQGPVGNSTPTIEKYSKILEKLK